MLALVLRELHLEEGSRELRRSTVVRKRCTALVDAAAAPEASRAATRISSSAARSPSGDQSGSWSSWAWTPVNVAFTGRRASMRRRNDRAPRARSRQRHRDPAPLAERPLDGVDQLLHVRAVLEVAFVLRSVAQDLA